MRWNDLTMAQKAKAMGIYVKMGITSLQKIREDWDAREKRMFGKGGEDSHSFGPGGPIKPPTIGYAAPPIDSSLEGARIVNPKFSRKKVAYGSNEATRERVRQIYPVINQVVDSVAQAYNVNPAVIQNRLDYEGMIDQIATTNDRAVEGDGEFRHNWQTKDAKGYDFPTSGFNSYGLDDVATLIEKGKVNPINEKWYDSWNTNEKGRNVHTAEGETWVDSVGLVAATLKYMRSLVEKDFPGKDDKFYDEGALAYYNRGRAGGKAYMLGERLDPKYKIYMNGGQLGHQYKDGGDGDGDKTPRFAQVDYMIRPQISIADNTKYEKPYTTNEILKEKKKYKQEQLRKNILEAQKKQAYIKEDKNPKSYAEREFDNKVQEIVDQTISQKASPGKIDFNTLETGISTALQAAILPEAATQALARPATALLGLAGIAGSNLAARTFTDYGSLGQALSPDNKLLSSTLDVLNPFGLVGGVYGNGVDKRLAEVLIRRGDALKNGINTTDNVFKHLFPDVPDVTKEMVGKKHPIASYIFDPRQKDLIYKINDIPKEVLESGFSPAQFKTGYDYNGTNMGRPYRGDIVDIFFNKGVNNTGFDYVRDMPTYFADYMAKNYPHKVPYWFRLGEASVNTPRTRGARFRTDTTEGVGLFPDGSEKSFIDPGGFRVLFENEAGADFADIWKYNGNDMIKKYGKELRFVPIGQTASLKNILYKPIIKTFGNFIDAHSTPIITQWYDTRPIYIPEVGEYEYNLAHP